MTTARHIAIIGAGMAGLTAAMLLVQAGHQVTVFDKGRQPGGRLATRTTQGFTFNHGCQFFTARDQDFAAATQPFAAPWPAAGPGRQAGLPSMASLAANLAAASGATLHQHRHVGFLERASTGWHLHVQDAAATPPNLVAPGGTITAAFDKILLAIPAPQAHALLAAINHPFADPLSQVHLAPCWALMLGFVGDIQGPATLKPAAGPIGWIARENTRPGRIAAPVCYTVHATAAWSTAHLESEPDRVTAALTAAFAAATGITTAATHARAHRWRHALADRPLNQPCLWDHASNLGLCGDWCLAGKLEAAYLSGRALGIKAAA